MIRWHRLTCIVAITLSAVIFTQAFLAQTKQTTDRKAVLSKITDNLTTPLDVTLKWLKNELSKYGTMDGGAYFQQLKPMKFSSCNLTFRYSAMLPPDAASSANSWRFPPDKEYSFSLADLDPHSISVSTFQNGTRILVGTWDQEPKIKIVTRNAITGETFPDYLNQAMPVMSLDLAKTKSGEQIRDALVHAIVLCQNKP